MKDVQATGDAFSPQKKTSSNSKLEISSFFLFFVDNVAWIPPKSMRIRNHNTML